MQADILHELSTFPVFQGLPDEHLQWLLAHAELLELQAGDLLFKRGQAAAHMYIVLEGALELRFSQGKQYRHLSSVEKGGITGLLPYSRMKEMSGEGMARIPSRILALHKDHFDEMEKVSRPLIQALVSVMTDRNRDFTRLQQQNDKMMALGKLSAGLAHELNNPASAISRSASTLKKHLHTTHETFKLLSSIHMKEEQVDAINTLLIAKTSRQEEEKLSMLERNSREDEIADWLEEQGIDDGYDMAETFVSSRLSLDDMEDIAAMVAEPDRKAVFTWIYHRLVTDKLVDEIEVASRRISSLIQSVKTYSHMDRGADKELSNIHTGIDSTLVMLGHKLKEKNISVVKDYDEQLPEVPLYVSEMNQVWTNLIDNAIDAMQEKGQLTIRTWQEMKNIRVEVIDNGSGIPTDIIQQIFDPFFTTKPVGKGTGLGLDIALKVVEQHQGTLDVNSEPGKTVFRLCFPMHDE